MHFLAEIGFDDPMIIPDCGWWAFGDFFAMVEYGDDVIFVNQLVIDPNFQGRRIGTEIMESVIKEATARGVAVRLQTHLVNRAAELYRRLGFQERGRSVTHILMEWRVGEAPMD